jgi:hypothetical protein
MKCSSTQIFSGKPCKNKATHMLLEPDKIDHVSGAVCELHAKIILEDLALEGWSKRTLTKQENQLP